VKRPAKRERTPDEAADPRAIKQAALKHLARRDHPASELERKLCDRGFASDVVASVLADLSAKRILDDERYIEHFVGYHVARGQGPMRIRAELRASGLPEESIDRHLDAVEDWRARARLARYKKFGAAVPKDFRTRAKQARFLEYRGFLAEHIRAAFDREVGSEQ
jgi:regulatory protein